MSYYSRNYGSSEGSWTTIFICIGILFLLMFGTNACSAETWNSGVCPECGQEVERY